MFQKEAHSALFPENLEKLNGFIFILWAPGDPVADDNTSSCGLGRQAADGGCVWSEADGSGCRPAAGGCSPLSGVWG